MHAQIDTVCTTKRAVDFVSCSIKNVSTHRLQWYRYRGSKDRLSDVKWKAQVINIFFHVNDFLEIPVILLFMVYVSAYKDVTCHDSLNFPYPANCLNAIVCDPLLTSGSSSSMSSSTSGNPMSILNSGRARCASTSWPLNRAFPSRRPAKWK